MPSRFRSPLSFAALLPLVASCAAPIRWRELEHDESFDIIWEQFVTIAGRAGYPPDVAGTDRGMRQFRSKWRDQPAPFRLGRRSRLNAEFERKEGGDASLGKHAWTVRFHIEQQMVKDISVGFEPSEDDWSDMGQDFDREAVLYGQLRLTFGQPLGIEPSFERGR